MLVNSNTMITTHNVFWGAPANIHIYLHIYLCILYIDYYFIQLLRPFCLGFGFRDEGSLYISLFVRINRYIFMICLENG